MCGSANVFCAHDVQRNASCEATYSAKLVVRSLQSASWNLQPSEVVPANASSRTAPHVGMRHACDTELAQQSYTLSTSAGKSAHCMRITFDRIDRTPHAHIM